MNTEAKGHVKTTHDLEFRERIERIAVLLSFDQDVSGFDFLDVAAAQILLKDFEDVRPLGSE
jgi:hypothetical protein